MVLHYFLIASHEWQPHPKRKVEITGTALTDLRKCLKTATFKHNEKNFLIKDDDDDLFFLIVCKTAESGSFGLLPDGREERGFFRLAFVATDPDLISGQLPAISANPRSEAPTGRPGESPG